EHCTQVGTRGSQCVKLGLGGNGNCFGSNCTGNNGFPGRNGNGNCIGSNCIGNGNGFPGSSGCSNNNSFTTSSTGGPGPPTRTPNSSTFGTTPGSAVGCCPRDGVTSFGQCMRNGGVQSAVWCDPQTGVIHNWECTHDGMTCSDQGDCLAWDDPT